MLIQQAGFADARRLTGALLDDPARWSAGLLAEGGAAVDPGRAEALLACWAEIAAAAGGSGSLRWLFAMVADLGPQWLPLATELAASAGDGDGTAARAAARRCAAELPPDTRAALIRSWAPGIAEYLRQAGGLEELLELEALHQRHAGAGEDAAWVSAAAWAACALTELHAEEAARRIDDLLDDGHGLDLWQVWARVAASMMSPEFLRHFQASPPSDPFPAPSAAYPAGLASRAVEAAHGKGQARRVQAEFAAQSAGDQSMLLFELGMTIASVRRLPSRKMVRLEGRSVGAGPRDAGDDAARGAVDAVMEALPAGVVERTGRMHGFTRRAILAFIDGDTETLAAVLDRIGTWDDDPGRLPYPYPRFRFPAEQALKLCHDNFYRAEAHGVHIPNQAAAEGAANLVDAHAPAEHHAAAHEVLRLMRAHGAELPRDLTDTAAGLAAFAATAAWLAVQPSVFRSRETARLHLIQDIRQAEAKALKTPDREIITISDQEALDFADSLYDGDCPLPRDPAERAAWEADILAVIKQHLLDTPADATTPDQRKALHERLTVILRAAAGTPRRTRPPANRAVVRNQPRTKTRRQRRPK